jgi:hypothetical protein
MHSSWLARSSVGRGRSSPLRRTVDRLERGVLVLAIVLALLAVPIAVLMGTAVQQAGDATVQAQNAAAYPTTATLLRDAPATTPGSMLGVASALGEWHTPAGVLLTGPVPVPPGTTAGARVPVWLNGAGHPVDPPLTADQAYWRGVVTVIAVLLATFILLLIGARVAHWLLDRRRLAEWEANWRVVEPRWTHRD